MSLVQFKNQKMHCDTVSDAFARIGHPTNSPDPTPPLGWTSAVRQTLGFTDTRPVIFFNNGQTSRLIRLLWRAYSNRIRGHHRIGTSRTVYFFILNFSAKKKTSVFYAQDGFFFSRIDKKKKTDSFLYYDRYTYAKTYLPKPTSEYTISVKVEYRKLETVPVPFVGMNNDSFFIERWLFSFVFFLLATR